MHVNLTHSLQDTMSACEQTLILFAQESISFGSFDTIY